MIKPENVIAEHEATVELPIRYVVHKQGETKFKISIYYECYTGGHLSQRDTNSDIPCATWLPKRGISAINYTYQILKHAGLQPKLEKFCERTYKAWRKERKRRRAERKRQREAARS